MNLCPGCSKGSCFDHTEEYLDATGTVHTCRCEIGEQLQYHGKMKPLAPREWDTLHKIVDQYTEGAIVKDEMLIAILARLVEWGYCVERGVRIR